MVPDLRCGTSNGRGLKKSTTQDTKGRDEMRQRFGVPLRGLAIWNSA